MVVNTDSRAIEQSGKLSHRIKQNIPLLFMIWLVLTVISPHQDLYKAFFHLIIVPAGFILILTRQAGINWKDPFLSTALVFFAYTGITTLFIGLGPMENQLRAFRWSVEITFGVIALFIWMPSVIQNPKRWGRFFLGIAFIGSTAAILLFVFYSYLGSKGYGRLMGLGALYNSVTMACILLIYFALGNFLLQKNAEKLSFKDKALIASTFFSVCLAVLLSQSRMPIAAMVVYTLFLGMMVIIRRPKTMGYVVVASLLGVTALVLLLGYLFGFEGYIDRLLIRGGSYRIDIWTGYLLYVPDSWLLGFGSGTEALFHPATEGYWKSNNLRALHPHNLFLGTLVDTGVIGLSFLSALIILLVRAIFKYDATIEQKVRLFGILGLIFILTLTGSQTSVSSIKAVWLYLWIPVIFIWFWCHKAHDLENDVYGA